MPTLFMDGPFTVDNKLYIAPENMKNGVLLHSWTGQGRRQKVSSGGSYVTRFAYLQAECGENCLPSRRRPTGAGAFQCGFRPLTP